MARVLIVDDIPDYLDELEILLSGDHEVIRASTEAQAREALAGGMIEAALVDIRLDESDEDNTDGLDLLRWATEHHPSVPIIMMSAYREFEYAVESLNSGAKYFLKKPLRHDEVWTTLDKVLSEEP